MIENVDDLLKEVYEDGELHDGLQGWLGYVTDDDDVLTVSFQPIVDQDGFAEPGEAIVGQWKLVPIDE